MNALKALLGISITAALMLSQTSCLVVRTDNGKRKGWYKNSNNPHHPATTNPGHTKGKSKGKK